jgi:hypothetical protein
MLAAKGKTVAFDDAVKRRLCLTGFFTLGSGATVA